MTPPVRPRTSRTAPAIRPVGRQNPPADSPAVALPPAQHPQPRVPSPAAPPADDSITAMGAALEQALWITTASSEGELAARTVEAAGRLTAATVACTVPDAGVPHTWGDQQVAALLTAAVAALTPNLDQPYDPDVPQRVEFAHLGLPDGLHATVGGAPLVVASSQPDAFGPPAQRLLALVVAHAEAGRERLRELALLTRRADSDPLTGLRHYRPFEERLAGSCKYERCKR